MGRIKNTETFALRLCHCCGFDLGMAEPTQVNWPDEESRSIMCGLLNILDGDDWSGRLPSLCSPLSFFYGLRILLGAIGGRNGEKVRVSLSARLGFKIEAEPNLDFEYQSTKARFNLLTAGLWLVSDWPLRFVEVFHEAGFTRSRFSDNLHSHPYWLYVQVALNLDTRPYLPSDPEIAAAANFLVASKIAVTTESLGGLMGIKSDLARRAVVNWKANRSRSDNTQSDG
ncbi:hypothetical protein [Pseudomonas veronii]